VKPRRHCPQQYLLPALEPARQMMNGLGLITATFVLTVAGVKAGADPSQVSAETVFKMGPYYVPTILTLWMIMIAIMSGYRITREGHE